MRSIPAYTEPVDTVAVNSLLTSSAEEDELLTVIAP